MKILELTRYGEDKEIMSIQFETKNYNELSIEINSVTKAITVECDGATIDEVLEAIEIVKSGKLVIEL